MNFLKYKMLLLHSQVVLKFSGSNHIHKMNKSDANRIMISSLHPASGLHPEVHSSLYRIPDDRHVH